MEDMLTRAIGIAVEVHLGQKDKAGKPYILHPLRIMQKFENEEEMIVAILHDVVEDSDCISLGYLESCYFKLEIINAVDAITKRPNEKYRDYIDRVSRNKLATKVKIEDLRDNMNICRFWTLSDSKIKLMQKYHKALKFLQENPL